MAAGDAKPFPLKNTAFRVTFPIFDADGDLVSGAAGLDSEVSKDGGTFTDCSAEATEIATSSGIYFLDLTADEMNADTVAIIVKTSTSGAKTTPIVLYPAENADIPVNVTAISGDTAAADNLESYTDGTTPIPANTTQISGDATAADNLEAACDGGSYNLGGGAIVAASVTGNVGGNVAGSIGSLGATAKADVNAEVDTALNTVIPGSPTADSINERIATMDGRVLGTLAAGTHNPQSGDAYARLGAPAGASVSADVAAVKAETAAIVADTGTDGVVVASASKTGYALAANGLDSVSTTAPAGVASNFREMVVALWRRHFKKASMSATELKTYADNGSTVLTTQPLSDDGGVQTQGGAV